MNESQMIIGNQEWCALPEIGVHAIKVRVDSGAATSAIHAYNIESFDKDDEQWLRYELHPLNENDQVIISCESKLLTTRKIKSSNGEIERRYVIETLLKMQDQEWPINITLTNRDEMGFRMLLGRQAMGENILIAPSKEFLLGEKEQEEIDILYQINHSKPSLVSGIKSFFKQLF